MLDLPRLDRIRLTSRPRIQRVLAWALLTPNYELLPGMKIELDGIERLPSEPVLYAMNHTDRYNYWPFQYSLWRKTERFTATWVKGKYYQNAFVGKFMELTNNIPTVSRGYLVSRDFLNTLGRPPTDDEYAALRELCDGASQAALRVPRELLERPRDVLGRRFEPARESYAEAVDELFRAMMRRFVELNGEAFDKGLDVLVFPEGTRSRRLSRGHIGLSQIALRYRRAIVPVGCNGSDLAYPGGSPIARAAHVVYRIGRPITWQEMEAYHVREHFEPFTPEAERTHRARFQGLVDVVMDRINALLDEPYRRLENEAREGPRSAARFI